MQVRFRQDDYRFGFNGGEKDNEIKGKGNSLDLGLRMYDTRLGRMMKVDPRTAEYPWQTPYAYHRNSPIHWLDYLGGGDGWYVDGSGKEAKYTPIDNKKEFEESGIDGEWIGNEATNYTNFTKYHSDGSTSNFESSATITVTGDKMGMLERTYRRGWRSMKDQYSIKPKADSGPYGPYNPDLGKYFPDKYTVSLSAEASAVVGVGSEPTQITLLAKGKDAGFYLTPTTNASLGTGVSASAGLSFSVGYFVGDRSQMNASSLTGYSYGISSGAILGAGGGIGIDYSPVGELPNSGFINLKIQVGVGLEGSPATGLNVKGGLGVTPRAYRLTE